MLLDSVAAIPAISSTATSGWSGRSAHLGDERTAARIAWALPGACVPASWPVRLKRPAAGQRPVGGRGLPWSCLASIRPPSSVPPTTSSLSTWTLATPDPSVSALVGDALALSSRESESGRAGMRLGSPQL